MTRPTTSSTRCGCSTRHSLRARSSASRITRRRDTRLRARQADIKAWRDEQGRGPPTSPVATVLRTPGCQIPAKARKPPVAVPGPAQWTLCAFPDGRSGSTSTRESTPAPSRARLRRACTAGDREALPGRPSGILTIVACEVLHHGRCTKPYAEIADEAGCSRTWVKATMAFAARAGLLSVERRPRPGRKDDTNVVRILSADWLAWIKTRHERNEKGQRAAGIGASRVATSPNGSNSEGVLLRNFSRRPARKSLLSATEKQGPTRAGKSELPSPPIGPQSFRNGRRRRPGAPSKLLAARLAAARVPVR